MEVQLASERVLRLIPKIGFEEAQALVEEKKVTQVAGTLGALLSRPRPDDITLSYGECRYEPFWRVTAHTQMSYERQRNFIVPTGGPEVKQITLFGNNVATQPQSKSTPAISFIGTEHCEEDHHLRRFYSGDGTSVPELEKYLRYITEEIEDPASYTWDGVCEPPITKSGAIVRQVLTEMTRPIKAQIIHSENTIVEEIDLCFRPIYAFEYTWSLKNKRVIVECDGLSCELSNGGKTLKNQFRTFMNPELLFDITSDVAGSLIPGGGIVVKLTQAAINLKQTNV